MGLRDGHAARSVLRHAKVRAALGVPVVNLSKGGALFLAVRTPRSERIKDIDIQNQINAADPDPWVLEHIDPAADIDPGDILLLPSGGDVHSDRWRVENVNRNYEGPDKTITHLTLLVYGWQRV